jgi:hypothetical protein
MHHTSKLRQVALFFLFFLPLLSLALNALTWVKFGIDQPFFDDWRDYLYSRIGSFALKDLTVPANGTMSPVGFALDALALRLLSGNAIAYQLVSMLAVLGALLLLQWKLLLAALENRWHAALCFVFTLLMLQPESYWGGPNLAYHQALPLVFILWALWLAVISTGRDAWRLPSIFVLGLLAGMSYVSGAFGGLITGGILVALGCVLTSSATSVRPKPILRAGIALSLAGALTTAIQVRWAILGDKNTMAWQMGSPFRVDFWSFGLGNVGHSLLLSTKTPEISMAIALLLCGASLAGGVWLIQRCFDHNITENQLRIAVIYLPLAGLLGIYLLQIMVARTHFRPPEAQTAFEVFIWGFKRFHYFWITLFWPWLIAITIVVWRSHFSRVRVISSLGPWIVALLIAWIVGQGALRHQTYYRSIIKEREITAACLIQQLQRGEGLKCHEFAQLNMPDMTYAYQHARKSGASFVNRFPLLAVPLGSDEPAPWFRLSRDKQDVQTYDFSSGAPLSWQSEKSAVLIIPLSAKHSTQRCMVMDLRVRLTGPNQSPPPHAVFHPLQTQSVPVATTVGPVSQELTPNGERTFHFRVESEAGFSNHVLLASGVSARELNQSEAEVRCRLIKPH